MATRHLSVSTPMPTLAYRTAHLLWGDFDACIGLEAVFEPLDGDAAHAVELLERAWGNELFLLGLHHHVPDGGEHAVDRVGGELLFQHLPWTLLVWYQVDALYQICAPLGEDCRVERVQRTSGEAQVIEEILGVLLARRWADGPCEDGVVPSEEFAGALLLFLERHCACAVGRHDNRAGRPGYLYVRVIGILHRLSP